MRPGDLVKRLREALDISQETTAARSGGKLTRDDLSKIEMGRNKATSDRVRAGLAEAAGVTRDEIADYLDERIPLEQLLAQRAARATGRAEPAAAPATPTFRNHPRWIDLCAEAKRLRALDDVDLERIADSPFIWAPVDSLDASLVADLASDLRDWATRRALTKS